MSDKIVPMPGIGVTTDGAPDTDEVEAMLLDVLEGARAGEITAVAFAASNHRGEISTGWEGVGGTRHQLGTAVYVLSHRYAASILERS